MHVFITGGTRGHRPAVRHRLGAIFATDQPSSSTITRNQLEWEPTHPSLLADLENIQP